jgi:hypothetical protein
MNNLPLNAQELKVRITDEMIQAAYTVFKAMAWYETVKPIVEGYQRKVLAVNQWTNAAYLEGLRAKLATRGVVLEESTKVILDPRQTYELSADDWTTYYRLTDEEREKAGLTKSNPEGCPLLDADNLLVAAQSFLIDVCEPLTGLTRERVNYSLEHRQKYLDLLMKMFAANVKEQHERMAAHS